MRVVDGVVGVRAPVHGRARRQFGDSERVCRAPSWRIKKLERRAGGGASRRDTGWPRSGRARWSSSSGWGSTERWFCGCRAALRPWADQGDRWCRVRLGVERPRSCDGDWQGSASGPAAHRMSGCDRLWLAAEPERPARYPSLTRSHRHEARSLDSRRGGIRATSAIRRRPFRPKRNDRGRQPWTWG